MKDSLEITYDPQILVGKGYYLSFRLIARAKPADLVFWASLGTALHRSLNDRTNTFFQEYKMFALHVFIILMATSLICCRCSGLNAIFDYLTFRRFVKFFPESIWSSSFSLSMVFYTNNQHQLTVQSLVG
jgi:hypothetical protein